MKQSYLMKKFPNSTPIRDDVRCVIATAPQRHVRLISM
jgi:hypothetical protein